MVALIKQVHQIDNPACNVVDQCISVINLINENVGSIVYLFLKMFKSQGVTQFKVL